MKQLFSLALICGLLLSLAPAALAQPAGGPAPPDSVLARLRRHPQSDTARVRLLLDAAQQLRAHDLPATSRLVAEALTLARRLHFAAGERQALRSQGVVLSLLGRFGAADSVNQQALQLARQAGDSSNVAKVLNTLANGASIQGQYERSLRLNLRALAIFERAGDVPAQAHILGAVAHLLLNINRPEQALGYYQRQLPLAIQTHSVYDQGLALAGLGIIYQQQNNLQQAESYLLQAVPVARQTGDPRLINSVLSNLGFLRLRQHQPAAAVALLDEALDLARRAHDPPDELASFLNTKTGALLQLGNYLAALAASREALALSQFLNSRREMAEAYENLATIYAHNGDFTWAFASQRQLQRLRDSLYSEQSTRQITEMEAKYGTERKEAQNRLQAAQLRTQQQVIRRRNAQLVAAGAVLLLLAGTGYLFYTRRRLRREVEFARERQRLERLRSQAVLEAEENERRRIGSDLHDGVGQLLTAARLNLNALGEQLQVETAGQQALLDTAMEVVDESFREVRSISHNLMPNALIKRGLTQAVRDFLNQITPAGHLKVDVEVVGLDQGSRLPPTVESVLFRVIQELVQNIVKHAQATEIMLQLIRGEDDLMVMVEDNGVGFDPADLAPDAGIGLRNVASRMAYLGGRADFDAAPGRGTIVTLEVPLQPASNDIVAVCQRLNN